MLSDVCGRLGESIGVVASETETSVAFGAQEFANFPRRMAVIDTEFPARGFGDPTDGAVCPLGGPEIAVERTVGLCPPLALNAEAASLRGIVGLKATRTAGARLELPSGPLDGLCVCRISHTPEGY